MSQTSGSASALLHVTVASGSRRVDLALPGVVPLAELVPDLARSVGLLDAATVAGGYRVVTPGGRELSGDSGLVVQGIEDGGLLTLAAAVDDPAPRVYDDVVEAMSDVVLHDFRAWDAAAARRTAQAAVGLLLGGGAVTLAVQRGSSLAAGSAAVAAIALLVGAVVLSRLRDETAVPVAMSWLASGYAGVAGLVPMTHDRFPGLAIAGAGAGALAAGLVALLGLGAGRALAIPPVGMGAVLLAAGLVMRATAFDPSVVLVTALVLVAMAGSVFPWLALGATGATAGRHSAVAPVTTEAAEIDPARVRADARQAHEILVSLSATVGLLLVLLAPAAVSLGLAGTVLAVLVALVTMLRTRQYHARAEVLVGLSSGVVGLVSVVTSLLMMHVAWRPATAVALVTLGGVLLLVTLMRSTPTEGADPPRRSARRGRAGDLAETVALVSLLPLLVVAGGLLTAIRG